MQLDSSYVSSPSFLRFELPGRIRIARLDIRHLSELHFGLCVVAPNIAPQRYRSYAGIASFLFL
jgi:hypothetical protein